MDALLDPDIELVLLTGPAGCGKTGITASFSNICADLSTNLIFTEEIEYL